jgi:hypothetical protein
LHFGVDDCDLNDTDAFQALATEWQVYHGIDLSSHPNGHANLQTAASIVKENRCQYSAGNETVLLGLTQFAHLSQEDFASTYLGGRVSKKTRTRRAVEGHRRKTTPPPTYDDYPWDPWFQPATTTLPPAANNPGSNSGTVKDNGALNYATLGYVTPVKNQGQCGDCWAFAATGCMEGAYYKATKNLTSFSEEQLVDCVGTQSQGCGGGIETDAYRYAQRNGGMDTESCYPYTSGNARYGRCTASSCKTVPFSLSYQAVPSGDANLLAALKAYSPVDCGIGVSNTNMLFQLYVSGIISSTSYCLPSYYIAAGELNHAVILVGYNGGATTPYWIFKNSWGTDWGIAGYFYMTMQTSDICGISSDAYVTTVTVHK